MTRELDVMIPDNWSLEKAARVAERHGEDLEVDLQQEGLEPVYRVSPLRQRSSGHLADLELSDQGVDIYREPPVLVSDKPAEELWLKMDGHRWVTNGWALLREDAPRPDGLWLQVQPGPWQDAGAVTLALRHVEPSVELVPKVIAYGRAHLQRSDGRAVTIHRNLAFYTSALCLLQGPGPFDPIAGYLDKELVAWLMPMR